MKYQLLVTVCILMHCAAFSQKSEKTPYEKALQKIEMENYAAAITELDKVIQTEPTNIVAFFKRGYCYGMLEQYDKAFVDMDYAITQEGNHGEWYYKRGIVRLNMRQKGAGCADLHKAVEMEYADKDDLISIYCK